MFGELERHFFRFQEHNDMITHITTLKTDRKRSY
jgi:hypothetical protein